MSSTENCLALSYHFCQPYLIVFWVLCLIPSQVSTLPLTYIHHSSKLSTNKSDYQLSKHRFCFLTDQAKCVLGSIVNFCLSDKILDNVLQEERCLYFVSQFQSWSFGFLLLCLWVKALVTPSLPGVTLLNMILGTKY